MLHQIMHPANNGLIQLPGMSLTGDIRNLLNATQGQAPGGFLSGPFANAGMPGLQGLGSMQQLLALAEQQARHRVPLSVQLGDGQVVRFALLPSDVHVAEEISTYLAGYRPAEFRADEAVPIVSATQLTDKFRIFTKNNAFRLVNVLASTQSAINEIDPETELGSFFCVDRALGGFLPLVTERTATKAYDPRQALARRIAWGLGLEREYRIFGSTTGLLVASANWNANNVVTITGGNEWNTSNGNPIRDMQLVEEASAMPITDWFFSVPSFNDFLTNQNVRDHMRQMLGDNAPSADVAQRQRDIVIPGLAPIHKVEGKVLNPSTGVLEFLMLDRAVAVHKPSGGSVNPEDIQTAVTWRFDGPSGVGFMTREFQREDRGAHGGTMMVSGYSEDPKFIANDVGGLIINTRG